MQCSNKLGYRILINGFTLAEVLITLAIIGVVAGLTVPTLVQEIQDQQLKTAWKQAFADISQASMRLKTDNGANLAGAFNNNDTFRNRFLPYLNYTKLCNANSPLGPDGCWHYAANVYKLPGTPLNQDYTWTSRMVLNNGMLFISGLDSASCNSGQSPNYDECGWIRFDINGFKGPNKVGKDIFGLFVLKNGNVIPFGTQGDTFYNSGLAAYGCNAKLYPSTSGWGCSADYLSQ